MKKDSDDEWTPCYGIFFSHDGDDDAAGGYVVLPVERRRSRLYPEYWAMRWTSRGESHERHMASERDFYATEDEAWRDVLEQARGRVSRREEKLTRARSRLAEIERFIATRAENGRD